MVLCFCGLVLAQEDDGWGADPGEEGSGDDGWGWGEEDDTPEEEPAEEPAEESWDEPEEDAEDSWDTGMWDDDWEEEEPTDEAETEGERPPAPIVEDDEGFGEPRPRKKGTRIDIGLLPGTLMGFDSFEAKTPADTFLTDGRTAYDFRLVAALQLDFGLGFYLTPEVNMGSVDFSWVVSLGLLYRLGLFDDAGFLRNGSLTLSAGGCIGSYEDEDLPGSFDMGFGGEFNVAIDMGLSFLPDNLGIILQGGVRFLKFTFNPDPDVTEFSPEFGGMNVGGGIGLRVFF